MFNQFNVYYLWFSIISDAIVTADAIARALETRDFEYVHHSALHCPSRGSWRKGKVLSSFSSASPVVSLEQHKARRQKKTRGSDHEDIKSECNWRIRYFSAEEGNSESFEEH